jgi:hypothetical protein
VNGDHPTDIRFTVRDACAKAINLQKTEEGLAP